MTWRWGARGLEWRDPGLNKVGLRATVTHKAQGDMKQPPALNRVLRRFGFAATAWAGGKQVHGRRVRRVQAPSAPQEFPGTDGFWTETPGVALRVFSADCVPIFVVDPRARRWALLHAGWRGVAKNILSSLVRTWIAKGSRPRDLRIGLGPHIRDCCFEVGPELVRVFRTVPRVIKKSRAPGRPQRVDLAGALRHEARTLGLRPPAAANFCTVCDVRFFSYRRDKTEKRQVALLGRPDNTHGQTT